MDDANSYLKSLFEAHYDAIIRPIIERQITSSQVANSSEQQALLGELESLLNQIEQFLIEQSSLVTTANESPLFNEWRAIFSAPESGELRRYMNQLGLKKTCAMLGCTQDREYIALYGSLMQGFGIQEKLPVTNKIQFERSCNISGSLYDLGEYPGLIYGAEQASTDKAQAEIYQVLDLAAFQILDEYEGYQPQDQIASWYVRRCIRLPDQPLDVWYYVFNHSVDDEQCIESGCWRTHIE